MTQYPTVDLRFFVQIPNSDEAVEVKLSHIPFTLFWRAYTIRQTLGHESLLQLFQFENIIRHLLADLKTQHPEIDDTYLSHVFVEFWDKFPTLVPKPPGTDREVDRALALTYNLLRERTVSHADAAGIASSILGRKIDPDAWRRRVDRWAKAHGLPKVEMKRIKT